MANRAVFVILRNPSACQQHIKAKVEYFETTLTNVAYNE